MPAERPVQKSGRTSPGDLGLGKGQQLDGLDAARQRIGRDRGSKEVHRTRDQIASRSGVFVHCLLDGEDESRRTLDLVDGDLGVDTHETDRIVYGELPVLIVVQIDELAPVFIGDATGERGLAGLPWTDDGDDAGVRERLADARL